MKEDIQDLRNYDELSLEDLRKMLDDIIKSSKDYSKNREFVLWCTDPKVVEEFDKTMKEYINNEYK